MLVMMNKNLVPKTLQITISGLENRLWEKVCYILFQKSRAG